MEQVIYNLINNAINYTGEDNTVTISILQKDLIRVEVSDTGKGIMKEMKMILLLLDLYLKELVW